MNDWDNTNTAVLFKNSHRRSSSDAPFNGSATSLCESCGATTDTKMDGTPRDWKEGKLMALTPQNVSEDPMEESVLFSGALFKNKKWEEGGNRPTHTGSLDIGCPKCGETTSFWISAWWKGFRDKPGKFFSIAMTKKDAEANTETVPVKGSNTDPDFNYDDDIPF